MATRLLSLFLSALWVAAAVFLATTQPGDSDALRISATLVVGLPGAYSFVVALTKVLGRPVGDSRRAVRKSLQSALVQAYRENLLPDVDITRVSMHVWIVPVWYRRLMPYRLRRRLQSDAEDKHVPRLWSPRLQRLALYKFQEHFDSNVTFRKNVGIIGRCIANNHDGRILVSRLDSAKTKAALRAPESWATAGVEITNNLPHAQAQHLANRYGQVAAVVIQERSGEAIGCVTLDLPPNAKVRLPNPGKQTASRSPALKLLLSTADQVAASLTQR